MFKFDDSEVICVNLSSVVFPNEGSEEELDWSFHAYLLLLCPETANFILLTLCLYGMYHGIDIRCGFVTSNLVLVLVSLLF